MAKQEKVITPPFISFSSLVNFLNHLRDHDEVPTRIDKSLMPKASGSQTSGMMAALKYMRLIDETGRPSDEFKDLVLSSDEQRKSMLLNIVMKSYPFVFMDSEFDLAKATSGEMVEKFRGLNISGSTITKTIAFFLAAAKEAGIKVSTHIRPPAAPRQAQGMKKVGKSKDVVLEAIPIAPPPDLEDEDTERFEIPIPGKSSVKVIVPNNLDADDWAMLQSMITVYINRWKGFKSNT